MHRIAWLPELILESVMSLRKVLHREEQWYTWFVKIRQEGKKQSLKFSRAPVTKPNVHLEVALTEKWAQKYGDKGIGFYAIHLGWVATAGVAMSLSSFSKLYVLLSCFIIHISFQLYYWFQFAGRCVCVCARSSIILLRWVDAVFA
ncbi:hypothetical protein Hdeb2414_s0003g00087841 [Helianthus debilis subsp. tardiflorus]